MRKIVSVFVVMVMVLAIAAPVYADGGQKFQDGIKQFFTSPINLVDGVKEETEAATFKPLGVIGGTFKGLFDTLIDAGGGLINALTFWHDHGE